MRRAPWLLLLAGLAACAHGTRTIMLDDERRPPRSPEMAARSANEALRDVRRRAEAGTLPAIAFEAGSSELPPEAYPALDELATLLLSDDRLKLLIKAYADDPDNAAGGRELSERRASAVKSYLVVKGVPPPSVRLRAEADRAKKSRVEFRVTPREWNAVY